MDHTESAFLSAAQGLPIPSSALIALIAVLFLGALVLRGQRQAGSLAEAAPAQHVGPAPAQREGLSMHEGSALQSTPAPIQPMPRATAHSNTHRGATMSSTTDSSSRPSPGFQLHWGRTLVALLGALALLTAIVTGILAPLTGVPAALPLAALGVFLLVVLGLRTMAVLRRRSRRRARVQSAIEEAMNPLQTTPRVNPAEAGLFDALSADDRGAGGPNSLQQIDEDGLPFGLERTFGEEVQASGPVLGKAAEPVEPWQPRAVPRPKYLELDKAERHEPEALEVQAPAPSSDVKLTQRRFLETPAAEDQTAEDQIADQQAAEEQAAVELPGSVQPDLSRTTRPKPDSMNLDEVLKRRRA